MGSDERANREMHSAWIDAVNAGGLDRLLAMMTDDVVFLNVGHSALGRDGFSANFSAAHEQVRIRCLSELEEVVVSARLPTRGAGTRYPCPRSSAGKRADSLEIASRSTANSPTAAGSWPAMRMCCPRWRG